MDKTGLDTLLETIRVLNRLEDFTSGLDVILETLRVGLGFEIGEFWRFDSTTDRFQLHDTIVGRSPVPVEFVEESRELHLSSGQGIPGYVLNSKKPLVLPDVETSAIFLRTSIFRKANFRSLVALPVIAGDEPLGVFEFLDRTPHPIPEAQLLRVLETLAGHISEFARRTKAEKLAKDRALLLQDVLERLPVGIFVKDRQGVYRYVNRTILSENALTAEEILGRTDVEIFGAEIGADSQLTDDIVRKTGEVSMGEIYIDSKTNPRFSLVKKTHLAGFDDEGFDIFGVVTNVTRQKKAEEALKLSEQRYRQVVDEQTELICRYRPDGTYTFVNSAFCRFYDKSAEDLIGKVWQPQVHPDDLDFVLAQVREIGRAHPSKVITSRIIDNKG